MVSYDPLGAASEIRGQLASEKRRLAFFAGAGTSMAVGYPGMADLTAIVSDKLEDPHKAKFVEVKGELGAEANVEAVLDRIRTYSELIGDDPGKTFSCLKGGEAKELDSAVCRIICDVFDDKPQRGYDPHLVLAQWLGALRNSRDWPVEIFTTNYDLLLERALEKQGVPFFDGFVGSVNPFFVPESVEMERGRDDPGAPPRGWTRLWKVHGSVNWRMCKDKNSEVDRIARLSGEKIGAGEEVVIFPSREKYQQSRKLPYIAFQDRLRKLLLTGECLLVVIGYSFSDEHLNEIILQGLRSNPHLAVMALLYGDAAEGAENGRRTMPDRVLDLGKEHRNLAIYGPDKACVGGIVGLWGKPGGKQDASDVRLVWDEKSASCSLGDFGSFTKFLERFIGFQSFARQGEEVVMTETEEEVKGQPQSQQ